MKRLKPKGYTFAEVLVASGLIGVTMGVVASLSATMSFQVEASRVTSVGTNYAENAASLYQLGLSQTAIQALLPTTTGNPDLAAAIVPTGTNHVTFSSTGTHTLANSMGILDKTNVILTLKNPAAGTNRTYTVQPYLPQLR